MYSLNFFRHERSYLNYTQKFSPYVHDPRYPSLDLRHGSLHHAHSPQITADHTDEKDDDVNSLERCDVTNQPLTSYGSMWLYTPSHNPQCTLSTFCRSREVDNFVDPSSPDMARPTCQPSCKQYSPSLLRIEPGTYALREGGLIADPTCERTYRFTEIFDPHIYDRPGFEPATYRPTPSLAASPLRSESDKGYKSGILV